MIQVIRKVRYFNTEFTDTVRRLWTKRYEGVEREREICFTPAPPGCGHIAAASEVSISLCLEYKASILRPVMAFLI